MVFLETEDGTEITGSFYYGSGPSVILLHQLGNDRNSWNMFANKLNKRNYTVLSIDLRGHGQSEGKWQEFDEEDFKDMIFDVRAAKDFLEQQGANTEILITIGASIGANTALNFAAEDEDVKAAALLSPGLNYKGIETGKSAKDIDIPTFIAVSEGDDYSFDSSKKIHNMIENSHLEEYKGEPHGTDMLKVTNLNNDLINWLERL